MGRIHSLLPVLQTQKQLHLLDEGGEEPGETDNDLVDDLQSTRIVLAKLVILGLKQTGTQQARPDRFVVTTFESVKSYSSRSRKQILLVCVSEWVLSSPRGCVSH